VGNTSLFDEEDEMNMSMESGFNVNRFSGLQADASPIARVMSPNRKGKITHGLTEAVMEVDEEDERQN